jgi:CheY-like chemotaxis protein
MGKDQSILIVDDRLDQREMAMQMLRRLNYSVDAVESGEKAVDYILKNQVDLVLLDMMMGPGIDGLETYRRMLLANPNQKAIIFSGYAETDHVKEAQNLGVGNFLKKPFSIEKIGLMIKKELEK